MNGERLWDLLPGHLQEEDEQRGGHVRALLRIIGGTVGSVEEDIRDLFDDLFIETCADWVVPYIGALVSNNLISDASRSAELATELFDDLAPHDLRPPVAGRVRADVARTIYYRRRKGTLPVLEELARNVMGWPVHAVEALDLLAWNQHVEHDRPATLPDVRSPERCGRIEGPFDTTAHTVDVRAPASDEGWYHPRNVLFHCWRLQAHPLVWVPAKPAPSPGPNWGYTVSPLGNPTPLFSRWEREGDETGLTTEHLVPQPIRRSLFAADLRAYGATSPPRPQATTFYGEFTHLPPVAGLDDAPTASLVVYRNSVAIGPAIDPSAPVATFAAGVVCRRLDPWPGIRPQGQVIAIDVVSGRLAVGDGFTDTTRSLHVSFFAGSAAAFGGGGYGRRAWILPDRPNVTRYTVGSRPGITGAFIDISAALNQWVLDGSPDAVVVIADSGTYDLPASLTIANGRSLTFEAADRERPLLQTPPGGLQIQVQVAAGERDRTAVVTLSGLLVEGFVDVQGELGRLRLWHTTLVPGRALQSDGSPVSADPSVMVTASNVRFRLEAAFSILGPVVMPAAADGLWLVDSIVDAVDGDGAAAVSAGGGQRGPGVVAERSTVFGSMTIARLDLSESIVSGVIDTERTQDGCVRFSWVPPSSVTPRRYRCQPDLAVERALDDARRRNPTLSTAEGAAIRAGVVAAVVPMFATRRYGEAAYGQLHLGAPVEITRGAEDESEMGALCHLKQTQRESNLHLRLSEYLPFGLDAALVYVT